jgi:uncharacterized protein YutE (UPF0331/DUF86 family)
VVQIDVVAKKVGRASAWLNDAQALVAGPLEELLDEVKRRDLASFYIFLAIQECIDLAAHWVADADWGAPDDSASLFDILADREVIDRELATNLRGAVGLRNRIAHGYSSVDHTRVLNEFLQGASALRRFLARAVSEAGL